MTVAQLLTDISTQLQSLGNGSITAAVHRSVLNNIVNSLTSIALGSSSRLAKTSAYTVVAADAGALIDCTSGTFSLSLTAAATLGSGFSVSIFNSGSGVITIDPSGSEAIRDSTGTGTTNTLSQGQGGFLTCDGAGFVFIKSGNISAVVQAALDLKAALASPTFTGVPAAPTAASGTDTTQIATTAFVKAAVDLAVVGLFDLKGSTDCSANPNYPAALKGDSYIVSVAGKIGGASGTDVSVGDVYYASADNAGGTEAGVGASWEVLESNIPGITAAGLAMVQAANAAAQVVLLGLAAVATSGSAADLTTGTLPSARLSTNNRLVVVECIIDGGGSVIAAGESRQLVIPCDFTLTEVTVLSSLPAATNISIEIEVRQCTYTDFDAGSTHPVTGDKISASAPITVSAAKKSRDSTLTGWTTALVGGSVLELYVNSATDVTRCTVCLRGTKT